MNLIHWLDSLPCRLMRHPDALRVTTPTRVYLSCPCGWESPGWDVAPAQPPQAPAITHLPISARPVLRLRRRQV